MKQVNQLFDLLPKRSKQRVFFLLIMITLMALIDVIGVSSIMPFISVLSKPEIIQENRYLFLIYNYFNFSNISEFSIFLGIIFLVLFFFSILFKSLTLSLQLRFILSHEYILGKKLIEGYFNQPYIWFLSSNSSDLGKNILNEVSEVIGNGMIPLMNIISQSVVVLALILLILFVNPIIGFKVIFIISFSYVIIFIFVNKFLATLGKKRTLANKDRFRIVNEAFGAIKDLKVLDISENYIRRFSDVSTIHWKTNAYSQIITQLPRFALEAISFGSMMSLLLYEFINGSDLNSKLPLISVYAIAGYRLLPSFQQIYVSFSKLRYVKTMLETLHSEFKNLNYEKNSTNQSRKIEIKRDIELKNISFAYPGDKKDSLKNISLKIIRNQKIGFTGVSGSGKSTLIDIILGLINPQNGSILIDNQELKSFHKRYWLNSIGYVPQSIYLSDDTILSNIAFGIKIDQINLEAVKYAARLANIDKFIENDLKDSYQSIIGERGIKISGGQRQRIGLARALYRNPSLLILDEGTSALDNITEKIVMDSINKLSKKITIIMVAHRLNTLKNCDKIFILDKSKIVGQGTYNELLINNRQFIDLHNLSD